LFFFRSGELSGADFAALRNDKGRKQLFIYPTLPGVLHQGRGDA
jgi:hypothetical protein